MDDKIVLNIDGKEEKFYKLIKFKSNITNKEYLIYTDKKYDEEGNLNIYSSILKEENSKIIFEKITDEVDKEEVEKAILKYRTQKKNS